MTDVYLSAQLPTNATAILTQAGISYEVFDHPGLITKENLIKHVQ